MMFSFIAQSIIKITTYTIKIIFNLIKVKKKIWPYKNFSYKKSNSALNNNKKIKKAMVNLHKSQMNPMRCFIYTLYRKKFGVAYAMCSPIPPPSYTIHKHRSTYYQHPTKKNHSTKKSHFHPHICFPHFATKKFHSPLKKITREFATPA